MSRSQILSPVALPEGWGRVRRCGWAGIVESEAELEVAARGGARTVPEHEDMAMRKISNAIVLAITTVALVTSSFPAAAIAEGLEATQSASTASVASNGETSGTLADDGAEQADGSQQPSGETSNSSSAKGNASSDADSSSSADSTAAEDAAASDANAIALASETPASEAAYAHSTEASQNGVTFTVQWNDSATAGEATTFHVTQTGGSSVAKARMDVPTYWDNGSQESVCDPTRSAWGTYYEVGDGYDFTFDLTASGTYRIYFYFMDTDSSVYYLRTVASVEVSDAARPSVSQIVSDAVAQAKAATDGSEYAMALWLHDWTLDQLEYDYSLNYCSAESGLTRAKGTCESYQRIYAKLLDAAGIANGRVTGNGHTWNAVKIDGKWCQMDLTWDDTDDTWYGDFDQRHIYFGLTDELMAIAHSDHTANYQASGYGYRSTDLSNNYFVRNGKAAEWADAYVERIQSHLDARETSFSFDADNASYPPTICGIQNGIVAETLNGREWTTTDGTKVELMTTSNVTTTSSTTWTAEYEFEAVYANQYEITSQPESVAGVVGTKVAFSVAATGVASYQWQTSCDKGKTWWDMREAKAQQATVDVDCTSYRVGRPFRCKVTFEDGTSAYSDVAWLTERAGITSQPESVAGVVGTKVAFSVAATGVASYQWQTSCDKGKTWWDMREAKAQQATVDVDCTSYRVGRPFRCKVTFEDGTSAYSDVAWLTERAE